MSIIREGNEKTPTILDNLYCPYCGKKLIDLEKTVEHVIGRRVVPRYSLENSWNLILNCCKKCNNEKSDLEDDISVITQLYSAEDVDTKLEKKARESFSRRTHKKIIDSIEELNLKVKLQENVNASFSMFCPPQIDSERAVKLASYYCLAFFYYLTYNNSKKRGYFFQSFRCINVCEKSDWGNESIMEFQSLVNDWKMIFLQNTAKQNFKFSFREYNNSPCWAWAVELNQSYRMIGFCGNEDIFIPMLKRFDSLQNYKLFSKTKDEEIYMRREIPLNQKNDLLFKFQE